MNQSPKNMSVAGTPCCFVTGHRPSRFPFPESDPRCRKIKAAIENEIIRLYYEKGIRGIWIGGAAGVDTWAAEIVLALQKQEAYRDLHLLLAIPFPEFADRFPPKQKERYQHIFEGCADSVIVCRAYRPDAYKKRNYYMVDRSACGIAVYDNDRSIRSGTGMTLNYAKKQNLPVILIHPDKAIAMTL